MGITCIINITKPSNGTFTPGRTVSGSIKYTIDKATKFKAVTVSLKGHGYLTFKEKQILRNAKSINPVYRNNEDYVDIDNAMKSDDKTLPGTYEIPFNFKLPEQIPASIKFYKNAPFYELTCAITYYIRIKFETPGLSFTKRFKKEIGVSSYIKPRLPQESIIYGEVKKLTHFFSMSKSTVQIKATIHNSIVKPGDKVSVTYEVINNSKVNINNVETKLIEDYAFTLKSGRVIQITDDVKDTDSKMGTIQIGASRITSAEILVPSDGFSVENSKLVVKYYAVIINVGLPMPHSDAVLKIPVQVGDDILRQVEDAPPSYWEVMDEEKGVDDDSVDAHRVKQETNK